MVYCGNGLKYQPVQGDGEEGLSQFLENHQNEQIDAKEISRLGLVFVRD